MAISDLKFSSDDFAGKDIGSLPDRPNDAGLTAAQLKARFDQIGKVLLALGAFNGMIDALTAQTGAGEIGAAVDGLSGEDVQALLMALKAYEDAHRAMRENPHAVTKAQVGLGQADNTADLDKPVSTAMQAALDEKVDKAEGMGLSSNDFTDADKKKLDGAAGTANVLTLDNAEPYEPTENYHPATKGYVDEVALSAGAVTSVFGRAGAVAAQAGDYTANMVGAAPVRISLANGDMNEATATGFYAIASTTLNTPLTAATGHTAIVAAWDVNTLAQLYFAGGANVWQRFRTGQGWGNWYRLYTTGNKPTASDVGALPLSGGELSGSVTVVKSGEVNTNVVVENDTGSVGLTTHTRRGIYDYTGGKWALVAEKGSADWTFNGNAASATTANYLKAGESVTSYPTAPGVYRVVGTNIFANLTGHSNYGILVIHRSSYGLHVYLDSSGVLRYGWSGDTFAEPTAWHTVLDERGGELSGNLSVVKASGITETRVANSNGDVGLTVNSNRGFYDYTGGKWVMMASAGTENWTMSPNIIEFSTPTDGSHGGTIDFHYNGSTANYTTRLSETASGTLTLTGNMLVQHATDYSTNKVRNIAAGTSVPGSLPNGSIYLVYE